MKFVDVTNDIAFRKIFGNENKKIALISFLNAVLDFAEGHRVEDVTILNPYQLPKLTGGKATIIDVKATDQNKNTFIVEMQLSEKKDFDKRVLYYASQSYTHQIERGDLYEKLNPTFFIGILDFKITQNSNYLSRHKIVDIETGEQVIRNMEFNFIELPKFIKKENELNTVVDQWVYFIKNAENLNVIPKKIKDKGLITAFEEADKHNWTNRELEDYDKIFIRMADDRKRMEFAIEKAVEKAVEKWKKIGENIGEKIGEKRTVLKVAKALKKNGASVDLIISSTGLTKEEIEKL